MKCDKLTLYHSKSLNLPIYVASEVDAAIDELKTEHHKERDEYISMVHSREQTIKDLKARIADLEKLNHDLCERVTENDDIRLHWEEIEQTRAENERLKAKLENVQASAYADSVDAGMRERRIRRALWLARALRARDIQRWWMAITCAPITERACNVWNHVERKCRAKAEEYK